MAEMYHVSSDDLEEALSVLRSLSDYQVPVPGSSATASGSVVKMLTETVQPVVVKRCVLWVCYQGWVEGGQGSLGGVCVKVPYGP